MTKKIKDITSNKDLDEIPPEQLDKVSGGVYRKVTMLANEGCVCRTSCTHDNVTESDGSAALSGDAFKR